MPAPAHFPEYFPNLFPGFSSVLSESSVRWIPETASAHTWDGPHSPRQALLPGTRPALKTGRTDNKRDSIMKTQRKPLANGSESGAGVFQAQTS
jgi:hypothetical protein